MPPEEGRGADRGEFDAAQGGLDIGGDDKHGGAAPCATRRSIPPKCRQNSGTYNFGGRAQ